MVGGGICGEERYVFKDAEVANRKKYFHASRFAVKYWGMFPLTCLDPSPRPPRPCLEDRELTPLLLAVASRKLAALIVRVR
jgi:hypothetical protein